MHNITKVKHFIQLKDNKKTIKVKKLGERNMDAMIYVAIFAAIILRLVLLRGNFILPTFYKRGNEMSFNLGSISTIIIAVLSALGLMSTSPELFSNPFVAFMTTYTVPQLVDGVITSGARNFMTVRDENNDETA